MPHPTLGADDLQSGCKARPSRRRSIRTAPQAGLRLRHCLRQWWPQSCGRRAQSRGHQPRGRHRGINCRRIFFQRSPALAGNECQVATRAGRKCLGQDRQNRNCHGEREATLFCFDRADTVLDVLTAEANSITAAKSGVQQHIQPDALARSDRPTCLIGSNVFLCPWRESVALLVRWVFNSQRGIGLYHLGFAAQRKTPRMASRKWRA